MIQYIHWFFTLSRFFLAGYSAILITNGSLSYIPFFVAAGLSDFFDGYFARFFNKTTQFGAVMDVLADKFLIYLTIIATCRLIPKFEIFYILFVFIIRDILLLSLWIYFRKKFKSLMIGKIYTVLQFLFVFTLPAFYLANIELSNLVNISTLLFTIFSLLVVLSYYKDFSQ